MTSRNATLAAAALAALTLATAARAELIYALAGTNVPDALNLVSFDSATPAVQTVIGPVGADVDAIDFRPATGQLYGVGYTPATTTTQVYTLSLTTGAATPVGAAVSTPTLGSGAGSGLVSIDFNPVVDRIRVVNGANGNLRMNPNDGSLTAADTNLAYAAGDPGAGTTPGVTAVAYTNNVAGATSTTLYGLEFFRQALVTVGGVNGAPSPNGGALFTVGSTVPNTQFDGRSGFDISAATGVGYAMIDEFDTATLQAELYTVNLATGALTLLDDEIGLVLTDIAVAPVPEPTTLAALAGAAGLLAARRRRA